MNDWPSKFFSKKISDIFSRKPPDLQEKELSQGTFKNLEQRTFLMLEKRNIQDPGITEFSYVSENGALYPYISLILPEVTFRAQINK